MKKIYLTLLLLIPAILAGAQGPIKTWNDQLDDFIAAFNEVNPAVEQLYADNGVQPYVFTYFEPESGNVVMEAAIADNDDYNKISVDVMNQARDIVLNHLAHKAKTSPRINQILGIFENKGTDVVLLYTTPRNAERISKDLTITPQQIKAAK